MNMQLRKIIRTGNRSPHSRRGVALIFTLGILGLLTVLALGFASTAIINRKVAYNTANTAAAQLLAQGALDRVRLALNRGISVDNIYSRSVDNPVTGIGSGSEFSNGDYDWLWKLHTDSDGVNLYTFPDNYKNTNKSLPTWQYVKGVNDEIIGRFAYVVKAAKGKLDPSVHFGEKIFPRTPDPDYETPTAPSGKLLRKGKNEAEIDFTNFKPALESSWYDKMKSEIASTDRSTKDAGNNDYLDKLGRFVDIADLVNVLGISTQTEKDKLNEAFEFRSSPDPEAFWLDRNGNGNVDKEEYYHRFNLGARFPYTRDSNGKIVTSQWESMTVDDLLKDAKLYSEPVVTSSDTTANEPDTGGIPWLSNWKYGQSSGGGTEASTDWTADRMKKQIAANIIQYSRNISSDTVSDVTADWDSPGNANEPAYAGLGRHPYINEAACALVISFEMTETPSSYDEDGNEVPPYTYTYKYTPTIACGTELIDIYGLKDGDDLPEKSPVSFFGNITFDYMAFTGNYVSGTLLDGFWQQSSTGDIQLGKKNFVKSAWTSTGRSYYTVPDSFWCNPTAGDEIGTFASMPTSGTFTSDTKLTDAEKAELFRVKDVQLHLRKAVLKCGNDDASLKQRDFSRFADSAAADFSPENTPDYTFTGGGQTKMFVRSYQVDDPRLNHYPSDWKTKKDYFATTEDDGKTTGYPGTRGAINAGVNPSTVSDGDKEKATDPAATGDHTPALSTAYIRHAPMESLWELGAIHRAKAWQTLNLSRTDTTTTTSKLGLVSGGGGAYTDGDGAILDQVKLTSRIASYGKVNLNTNTHGVLHALFANVKVGKDLTYDDYALSSGTDYSLTDHATVTEANDCLLCKIASISSHTPLKSRAELLAAGQTHADGDVKTLLEAISDKLLKPSNADPETDREREQLIGKVINLTKAESSNEINVIVLAQTIKDIGPETGTITIQKNWGSTDDLRYRRAGYLRPPRQTETNPKSTRLNLPSGFALSENATITDKKRGQYKNGADQITGEAKLVVILYNDSGIWKIRRYEYAQ